MTLEIPLSIFAAGSVWAGVWWVRRQKRKTDWTEVLEIGAGQKAWQLELQKERARATAEILSDREKWLIRGEILASQYKSQYLAIDAQKTFIRLQTLTYSTTASVKSHFDDFPLSSIRIIKTAQGETTVTRHVRRDREITEPGKAKSPIKRAVVGGLVLGPVGAVVGAVSGIAASPGTQKTIIEYVAKEEVVKSTPYLIIEHADVVNPILHLEVNSMGDAELWRTRIEAAIYQNQNIVEAG